MKRIFKKYFLKVAIIWSGCFIALLLMYFILLSPQEKIKKNLRAQVKEKKREYESAKAAANESSKKKLYDQIDALRNEAENYITEDSTSLTFGISELADDYGVSSFGYDDKARQRVSDLPGCENISEKKRYQVSFTSGFKQFAMLLNAMERHSPIIFVDRFTITRSNKSRLSHEVKMDVSVFARKRQDS